MGGGDFWLPLLLPELGSFSLLSFHPAGLGQSRAGPRRQWDTGDMELEAGGVGGGMGGLHTLTPNICRRSGSLNRKGMLETCSRLGCCFSVGSEGWSGWLSVCAASSVCCGQRTRAVRCPSQLPSRREGTVWRPDPPTPWASPSWGWGWEGVWAHDPHRYRAAASQPHRSPRQASARAAPAASAGQGLRGWGCLHAPGSALSRGLTLTVPQLHRLLRSSEAWVCPSRDSLSSGSTGTLPAFKAG